jgi:hypothetical protein
MVKVIVWVKDEEQFSINNFWFLPHVSCFLSVGYARNKAACVTPQK